jgi:hypothetical protein
MQKHISCDFILYFAILKKMKNFFPVFTGFFKNFLCKFIWLAMCSDTGAIFIKILTNNRKADVLKKILGLLPLAVNNSSTSCGIVKREGPASKRYPLSLKADSLPP